MREQGRRRVIGFDVSLNHGAAVELEDGKLSSIWYVTNRAGVAKVCEGGTRLVLPKAKDPLEMGMARLAFWESWLRDLLAERRPSHVGVEGYAYRAEQGAHQLGEIGGVLRLACWHQGVRVRVHDPQSIKMWAAHDGTACKGKMAEAVAERWAVQFDKYTVGKYGDVTGDLVDAYVIARLVWLELQLREGEVELRSLPEKEIRVFNRITATYPVNLLDRDWLCREAK